MSKADNEEWELMYDKNCWYCKRLDEGCAGKPPYVQSCLNFEYKKEYKDGTKTIS